jgi:hypothetical protein
VAHDQLSFCCRKKKVIPNLMIQKNRRVQSDKLRFGQSYFLTLL